MMTATFQMLIFPVVKILLNLQNHCPNQPGLARTDPEVMAMLDNKEFPIGFTMELAQHSDVLNRFSQLSQQDQQSIVEEARLIKSHNQMRDFVESIFK